MTIVMILRGVDDLDVQIQYNDTFIGNIWLYEAGGSAS